MANVLFDNEMRARRAFIENNVPLENGAVAEVGSTQVVYLNGAFYFKDSDFGQMYLSVINPESHVPDAFSANTV